MLPVKRFEIGLYFLNLVFSRLLFFQGGLNNCCFQGLKKWWGGRSEAFTISRRSDSK